MVARIISGGDIECPIKSTTLGEFLFEQAEKYGKHICQIDGNLQKSETYASVNKRSVRLALSLRRKGLSPEDVVLICSSNTLDNAIPLIAFLYLAAKPISLDPSFSLRSTKHLISLVSPRIIFVEESAVDLIEQAVAGTNLEVIVLGRSNKYQNLDELILGDPEEHSFKPTKADLNNTAIMFFSSGTSGLPKAICHSHRSFLRLTFNYYFMITENRRKTTDLDVNFHFTSLYWISGVALLFLSFLSGGARIFSADIDGGTMLEMIETYKISFLFLSPLYTYKLTNLENSERYNISSVNSVMTGGTPLSLEQFKRFTSLFNSNNIIFAYGMTEANPLTKYDPKIDKAKIDDRNTPCGRVNPGNLIKIVDPDTEQTLDFNQEGEIRVKSKALMVGYHKTDSTSSFDDDGFFKTGDLGYFDSNEYLHVVGRMKEMFKYLTWHIVPSFIEAVILEHPAVAETVVFGIPHEEDGEVPTACVVLKENSVIRAEEIQDFVANRVADREKLRGGVYFVNSLSKTPTGKLIRKEIRAKMLESLFLSSE